MKMVFSKLYSRVSLVMVTKAIFQSTMSHSHLTASRQVVVMFCPAAMAVVFVCILLILTMRKSFSKQAASHFLPAVLRRLQCPLVVWIVTSVGRTIASRSLRSVTLCLTVLTTTMSSSAGHVTLRIATCVASPTVDLAGMY